jgi:quercetin dioxygenase-like cupin family protein
MIIFFKMKIKNWRKIPIVSNPHNLDIRELYDNPQIQIRQVILRPGDRVRPFLSPIPALLYVSRGSAVVQSGELIKTIDEGELTICPADKPTSLFNHSDKNALILAIRAPKPTIRSLLL